MFRFVARRAIFMLLSLFSLVTLVFLMIKIIPGDEAHVAAGEGASPEIVEAARVRLGLDQPLPAQFLAYLWRLLHADLGTSTTTFQPISANLLGVLPYTLELVSLSLLLTVVVAIPTGMVMAANRGGPVDHIGRVVTVIAAGMPIFWVGFMLQFALSSTGTLPISGSLSVSYSVPPLTGFLTLDALLSGDSSAFEDSLAHLVLPVIVLATPQIAVIIRTMRTSMLGELDEDYILMAQSKGASRTRILVQHGFRNAAVPTVTMLGLQVGYMIGGAVIVESVFSRPGVGAFLTSSVVQKDSFAVLGAVLFIGMVVLITSFLVDLFQMAIDPRVRRGHLEAAS